MDDKEEETFKEIHIDVTNSAPSFDTPSREMSDVMDKVISYFHIKKPLILDFGAGKLRNTLYLLEKGYDVRAVEFEKISRETEQAKKLYEKADEYEKQFKKLVFPHDFFNSQEKFDLILLINVCSVMPVPSERFLVIQYCREKLKENGYVLWYSIHRDQYNLKKSTPDVRMGDGYYFNKTRAYQTFYRDYDYHEIDSLFYSNGFREEKEKYFVPHNIVKLFRRVGKSPITTNILNAELIRQYVVGDQELKIKKRAGINILKGDQTVLCDPNPTILREEQIYVNALEQMPTSSDYATEYHNLITAILMKLFIPPLKNPKIEFPVNEGDQRIDIIMTNSANAGFFNDIIHKNDIRAPYVIIECKNYEDNIGNPELSQITDRFNPTRGHFGFLIYRKSKKEQEFFQKCINRRSSDRCIIPLNDKDIIKMLTMKLYNENIDDFLSDKLQLLDFGNSE
ncbi:MAG: class I SAM-dependent methyltransferase [Candidatus Nitrosocosmicus sp.]